MKETRLDAASGNCCILVGESTTNLPKYLWGTRTNKVLVVTDSNVDTLHGEKFSGYEKVVLAPGEESKNLSSVEKIYIKCLEMELERSSFIIGIGGGIVCDIANFAAATYLRGINCGLVPTTLLAQADASIGGKNGVNLHGYKNLIGTIRQPKFCLVDLDFLKTLPKDEVKCGFAEIIKHGAIADQNLFAYLEKNHEQALSLENRVMEKIVLDSINVKANIVRKDEQESNERRKVNFGHTFAHALEKVEKINHGQAVAIGMVLASRLSVKKGLLKENEGKRLEVLIEKFGLPISWKLKVDQVMDAIRKDKKRQNDQINMVLLEAVGKAKIQGVDINELEHTIENLS